MLNQKINQNLEEEKGEDHENLNSEESILSPSNCTDKLDYDYKSEDYIS